MAHRPLRVAAKSVFTLADLVLPPLRGPRILLYHQIEAGLGREMEVPLDVFQTHLDWMERIGEVLDLETALATRDDPGAEPKFVLTFDDGYEDVYRYAFPLLVERGWPFTIYLTTNPVESRVSLFPDDRAKPLTWDQLGEMMDSGLMTLGAHTHRHADLRIISLDQTAEELETSDRLIQERVGVVPRHFAYPWGYWSATAETLVVERYATAALASVGSITTCTDQFRLPRLPIQYSDGFLFFKQKVRQGLRAEEWARQRLKGYKRPRSVRVTTSSGS